MYRTVTKACGSGGVGNASVKPSKLIRKDDFCVVGNRGTIVVEGAVYYRIFCTRLACFRSHFAFTSCKIVRPNNTDLQRSSMGNPLKDQPNVKTVDEDKEDMAPCLWEK